jgi:hypothetical protein
MLSGCLVEPEDGSPLISVERYVVVEEKPTNARFYITIEIL